MFWKIKSFTLLELLIVVAIIGILISVLLPSLHGSRERAMQAVCASNQSQLAVATTLYATQENNWLPAVRDNWPQKGHWQTSWLLRLVWGDYIKAMPHDSSNFSKYFDSINNPAFKCPKGEKNLTDTASTSYAPEVQFFGLYDKSSSNFKMSKLSEVSEASQMIMFGTKWRVSPNWAPFTYSLNGSWHANYSLHPYHETSEARFGINLVMADTRVSFFRYRGAVKRTWPQDYLENALWSNSLTSNYHWKRKQQGLQEKW